MRVETFLSSLVTSVIWRGLDRLAGLAKHLVVAASIGLTAQLDVFYMAIALFGVFVASWAGLFDVIAVPRMVEYRRSGQDGRFRSFVRAALLASVGMSAVLAMATYLTADVLAKFAIGFDNRRQELLLNAFLWLIPAICLYVPYRFLGSVARANRRFASVYQSEFIAAVVVLSCVIAFNEYPYVLVWSFSLGIFASFIFIAVATRSSLTKGDGIDKHDFIGLLVMTPSLLILQGAHHLYVLVDRVFISFLPEGAVGALAYGLTLVGLIPALLGLERSFLTIAAESKSDEQEAKLNELISFCIFLTASSAIFLFVYGELLVRAMFERGLFGQADTEKVTNAISGFAWMLLPLFLMPPLDHVFQVHHRLGVIVRRVLVGLLANVVLNAWFLFVLGWGIWGVALATSISYWIMLLTSLSGLRGLGLQIWWRRHVAWLSWMLALASPVFLLDYTLQSLEATELVRLAVGSAVLPLLSLAAGTSYRGAERELVAKTLARLSFAFAAALRRT
jgi:putative peptidoglycan lipid II flippase